MIAFGVNIYSKGTCILPPAELKIERENKAKKKIPMRALEVTRTNAILTNIL